MALNAFRESARAAIDEVREIDVRGEVLRFRTPGTAELFPSQKLMDKARAIAPRLSAEIAKTSLIMALCYVASPEDGEIDALEAILDIANRDALAFGELTIAFQDAFADCLNWGDAKEAAKNASKE